MTEKKVFIVQKKAVAVGLDHVIKQIELTPSELLTENDLTRYAYLSRQFDSLNKKGMKEWEDLSKRFKALLKKLNEVKR